MNTISVDFNKVTGKIKPLHSVCCAPYVSASGYEQEKIVDMLSEGNIPYCRLHDCCGAYGGSKFVDISNIFKDFDADENDENNYDFHYTDEYIGAIQRSGCESYYRLGETIEWGSKKYTTLVPKDFKKWARICEHIIMHYNEGWANGFHYNIKYWEIWNEPENHGNKNGPCMWAGTKEEFFELYNVTSKHLKKCFPEIKIGGYGSCGFYAVTRENIPEPYKMFVSYFTDFLKYVKAENCPLDFFSWHIYSGDVDEIINHGKYVRETLDSYGFTQAESHLNEWNIHSEGTGFLAKHTMEGASFNVAVLAKMQETNYIDKAMYYCFSNTGRYNGFLDQNDGSICPPWYSYVAYGKLYSLGNAVKVDNDSYIYAVAAKNDETYSVLLANYNCDDTETQIDLTGISDDKTINIKLLDDTHMLEEVFTFSVSQKTTIKISLPKQKVVLITA